MGDKALRVVDGAIYVAKSAPLGTAVKVKPYPLLPLVDTVLFQD